MLVVLYTITNLRILKKVIKDYTRTVAQEFAGGKEPAEVASQLIEGDTVKYTYHLNYNDISPFGGLSNVPDDERDKLIQELELIER